MISPSRLIMLATLCLLVVGAARAQVTVPPGGNHNHTVSGSATITSGGDAETAPAHVRLAYMIRHD